MGMLTNALSADLHKMIATLLCDHVRKHDIVMQKRLAKKELWSSAVDKCADHVELRVQFGSRLKKLVFSMCLLQANDVVILHQTLSVPFFP